jgi:hypothetical protein
MRGVAPLSASRTIALSVSASATSSGKSAAEASASSVEAATVRKKLLRKCLGFGRVPAAAAVELRADVERGRGGETRSGGYPSAAPRLSEPVSSKYGALSTGTSVEVRIIYTGVVLLYSEYSTSSTEISLEHIEE